MMEWSSNAKENPFFTLVEKGFLGGMGINQQIASFKQKEFGWYKKGK